MPQYPPRSTKELGRLASIQVDSNTFIRLYFRSADLLIKQARVYKMEKDYQHAYVLYMKYTNLGLKELPKHPQYKAPENKKARNIITKNCLEALDALETMKPILTKEYQQYVDQQKEQERKQQQEMEARHAEQLKGVTTTQYESDMDDIQQKENEQWSLQNVLKDVAGVGYNDRSSEFTSKVSTYPITQYPSTTFENKSDGFSYQPSHYDNQLKLSTDVQPPLPPKPIQKDTWNNISAPAIPPKVALEPSSVSSFAPDLPPKVTLDIEPLKQPLSEMNVSSGVTTERGEPLRELIVPAVLQNKFLNIAKPNTGKNIETCGILAGTLKNNVLQVTTLIIPKQTGTSDTCTTENEEELFEYQDAHDLLTFGWIHTHPSQSCFLSSVDLHTHCSYQLMLPEAIAIVCAPKHKPSYGVFRLTDPPGLDVISSCKIERAFHPHPDLPIYTDTHNTSHVTTQVYDLKVIDLR
ncbi:uncharacterized protein BX664DRAFT_325188 [Halteromyces radiatus]|uniref:uncharacterized protein n=1 Tax=Halteromyces radiatus TaxID=101107 RepID=UPI00221FE063|nr:uncharacterized protein BX664DRAFT_325188 [Halteromyces radiatus]KAI8096923.1 hypothetical protein BX664DRAFT_325188 [Halteromyces radiatus]